MQVEVTQVLLVDDDEDNLELFKLILEHNGYGVDAYPDPVKALLEFKPNYYDILILDYVMTAINGMELCKRLKEKDAFAKIIFLTASHEQLYIDNKVMQELRPRIIRKPVITGVLLEQIRSILGSGVNTAHCNLDDCYF
jgi:DNA-binding response OmpR family regulator